MPQNDELIAATLAGDLDKVKEMIESGADPNSVDASGMGTLLNFHPKVTKYLLQKGADPDIQRNENILPVLIGVAGFNTECVRLMLDAGANPNIKSDHNGETALHHAASGEDLELVSLLLDADANPNAKTKPGMTTYALWRDARVRGETPLHRAAAWGSTEVIKLLLDNGADPSIRDANNDTPLSWASWHQRDKSIIDQLAYENSGVGPDIPPANTTDAGTESEFWQAVVAKNVEKVTAILADYGIDVIARHSEPEQTPQRSFKEIFQAVKEGDTDRVVAMIEADSFLLNIADHNQSTPLTRAFAYQHLDLAHLLIQRGANVFAMNHSDKWPMRTIVEKSGLSAEDRARILEAAIASGACEIEVFQAVWRGDHQRVRAIVANDPTQAVIRHADPDGANGFYNGLPYCGLTPLHYAVIAGDAKMVQLLLKAGAEVDAIPHAHEQDSRHTPMYQVPEGCGDIAQLLVDHGADVNRSTLLLSEGSKAMREVIIAAGAGGSPLMRALVLRQFDEAAKIIRDDPTVINDRLPNASIDTPLHMAAKAGSTEIARLLLDQGMDVDALSSRGKTALAIAPEVYCSLDMFQLLVEHGADVHFNNDFPMHASVWQHAYGHHNYESVIRYLAEKGSRVHGLCHCAQGGNVALAKILLELGANVNETDRHGRTALDYCTGVAGEHQHEDFAKLLIENGGQHSADL